MCAHRGSRRTFAALPPYFRRTERAFSCACRRIAYSLARRAEEVRRRDDALEREQELTAFFAERLREIEAPRGEAQEAQASPEPRGSPETGAAATHKGAVPGDQREAQEAQEARLLAQEARLWGLGVWEIRLVVVLVAAVCVSAVLYAAVTVLSL